MTTLQLLKNLVSLDTNECVLWPGRKSWNGYGLYCDGSQTKRCSRFSLEKKLGRPIQDGMLACHTCDVPACVNPRHLFEGTQSDNMQDSLRKGRFAANIKPFAGRKGFAKLAPLTVKTIRVLLSEGMFQKDIAAKFGVSQTTISKIKRGDTWA